MHLLSAHFARVFVLLVLVFAGFRPVFAQEPVLDSLMNLVEVHLNDYHNEWAYVVMDEVDNKIDPNQVNPQLARYYSLKSAIEGRKLNYEEQFRMLEKFESAAQELEDQKIQAQSQLGYASYYESLGDLKKALPFFLKALDLFVALGEESQIAYLYNKLGIIYYSDGDYKQAQTYFFASFVFFTKHKNELTVNAYWIQNCLSNIGLCYLRMNNPRKALAYMRIALEYCKTASFKKERAIAVIQTHLGQTYGKLGQYREAIDWFSLGIKGCFDPNNNETEHGIESLINLAEIYTLQKDFTMAEAKFKEAYQRIQSGNFNGLLGYYYAKHAVLDVQEGDFKSAYYNHAQAQQFADSVDKVLEKSTYSRQILMYNLEKQKLDNAILQTEYNYKSLQNKVVGILIFLALASAFLAYNNLVKTRSRNKELETLNKKIQDQKHHLEELNTKLIRTNQNKNYLIQSIAHDLRTPIGNIQSLNTLMEEEFKPGSEQAAFSSLIQSSCKMAINIIEDILDQSMIERGKLQLKFRPVNLHEILHECVELLRFRFEPKNIQIRKEFGKLPQLEADADRIKRVILNILMNAIKFSPKDSVIVLHQELRGSTCIVSISDKGIGMDAGMISQIFDKFTSAGREGLNQEKTIGIGLSIAKSIVEEHGGKIKVESTPDSGSTFYIELPQTEPGAPSLT